MFAKLSLASATAALAFIAAAPDFAKAPSLMKEAQAESAAYRYGHSIVQVPVQTAQRQKFEKAPHRRAPIKRAPTVPTRPSNNLASPFIDLVGEYFNPQIQEGMEGSHYCSNESSPQQRSRYVQIIVRNKGTNVAAPVHVSFTFATGQFLTHTIPLIQAGDAKGSAVAIPDQAWKNGKAQFHISIDHTNQVNETNESNNAYYSFCAEPN